MNNLGAPQRTAPSDGRSNKAKPSEADHQSRSPIPGMSSCLSAHAGTAMLEADALRRQHQKEAMCTRTTFYVNADWILGSDLASAKNIVGQMYVECLDPPERCHPYPIVLIHGDFHTGQVTKPDGQPGWASFFLKQGFQVYIVDLPACARSNFLTKEHFFHRDLIHNSHTITAAFVENELTAPGKRVSEHVPPKHERAKLHDKWPGTGQRGDPIFANYCASLTTLYLNKVERQSIAQNALRALLNQIGKSILIGEGTGGNMAWLATDVEPDLVAGVIAIEPAGPPFGTANPRNQNPHRVYTQWIQRDESSRIYGLTDIPLTYDPPAHHHEGYDPPVREPLDITHIMRPDRNGACFMQRKLEGGGSDEMLRHNVCPSNEARQLINLKKVPHALVTAHASSHILFDWATAAFMAQAGVGLNWIRLEDHRIYGNGHLMFLETNSDDVAQVLIGWIDSRVTPKALAGEPLDPISPPESRAARDSIEDTIASKAMAETIRRPLQHTSSSSPRSSAAELPKRQPASTPTERTPGHSSEGAASQGKDVNHNKRPAPSSSVPTSAGSEKHSSSSIASSTWGKSQKRPRLDPPAKASPTSASPQSPPPRPPEPALQQPRHVPKNNQQSGPSQGQEQPVSDLAMMRPPHPEGGPVRYQTNVRVVSPMRSPVLGHTPQPRAPSPFQFRPTNLYEHLAIGGQQPGSTVKKEQRQSGYGYSHSTARFERQTGTAEESIAGLSISHLGRGVSSPSAGVSTLHLSPVSQPQHLQAGTMRHSPTINMRELQQANRASPNEGMAYNAGHEPPYTPSLPPSTLRSDQHDGYASISQRTPPSPSPAPRVSSNPASSHLSASSPALPGSRRMPASK
ncbi:hypothetical protein FZEAL_8089 [Fusarium zealandicum]|uniref:AB hydrolase-1 domain-containing protein n=1 Tax=Fusarium zealandicum TaxID=1053134 RepID=A0A8H4XH81_9HYPO|nr:hypothetical protein FZEAL_8089 [Fusarium zealandicum]